MALGRKRVLGLASYIKILVPRAYGIGTYMDYLNTVLTQFKEIGTEIGTVALNAFNKLAQSETNKRCADDITRSSHSPHTDKSDLQNNLEYEPNLKKRRVEAPMMPDNSRTQVWHCIFAQPFSCNRAPTFARSLSVSLILVMGRIQERSVNRTTRDRPLLLLHNSRLPYHQHHPVLHSQPRRRRKNQPV